MLLYTFVYIYRHVCMCTQCLQVYSHVYELVQKDPTEVLYIYVYIYTPIEI